MAKTNPKTRKGWQRVRVHGGLAFRRQSDLAKVAKDDDGDWRIYHVVRYLEGPRYVKVGKVYSTWWDAVQAANGGVE